MDHDLPAWMAIGLVVGLATRWMAPGRGPGGPVLAALLGVAGALLAAAGGAAARLYRPGAIGGFVMAAAGAVSLVLLYRLVMRRRRA